VRSLDRPSERVRQDGVGVDLLAGDELDLVEDPSVAGIRRPLEE